MKLIGSKIYIIIIIIIIIVIVIVIVIIIIIVVVVVVIIINYTWTGCDRMSCNLVKYRVGREKWKYCEGSTFQNKTFLIFLYEMWSVDQWVSHQKMFMLAVRPIPTN